MLDFGNNWNLQLFIQNGKIIFKHGQAPWDYSAITETLGLASIASLYESAKSKDDCYNRIQWWGWTFISQWIDPSNRAAIFRELVPEIHRSALCHPRSSNRFRKCGFHTQFDKIIFVSAPSTLRIQRVMQRDGVEAEDIIARMNRQWRENENSSRRLYYQKWRTTTLNPSSGSNSRVIIPKIEFFSTSWLT